MKPVASVSTLAFLTLACAWVQPVRAQSALHAHELDASSTRVWENKQIRVVVPLSWRVSTVKNTLVLTNENYTLSIGYDARHASGISGGRFVEAFSVPWLGTDDGWTCSLYMNQVPRPTSRRLLFMSLILDTGAEKVREHCGIEKNLGGWNKGLYREEQRWFGGYFTTASGGWFFDSDCGEMLFTLVPGSKGASDLPDSNDLDLNEIINEAIDIVASIKYKRCAPLR